MTAQKNETANQVIKGGIAILVVQACTIILYFLSQRLILSFLTKEENGILFAERRMVDLILVIIVDFGLNGIVLRKIIQEPERIGVFLSSLVAFRFVLWSIASVICVGVAIVLNHNVVDVIMWCLFLLLTTRSGLLRYALELPYRAKVQLRMIGAISIIDPVLFFVLVYVNRFSLTPSTVIMLFMLSAIPGFIVMAATDKARLMRLKNVEFGVIKEYVYAAIPVIASIVLVNLHDKIDAMFLDWFTNPTQLGIFGAAYTTLSPITGTVPLAVSAAVVPVVARLILNDPAKGKRYVWAAIRLLIAASVLICSLASLATPWIVELVSQGRYADNQSHFFVFLWMPVPIFLLVFIQELIIIYNKQKLNVPIAAVLAGVVVVAGLVLIPLYGAMGAIYAKLFAVVLGSATALYFLHRVVEDKMKTALLLRSLFLVVFGVTVSIWLPTIFSMQIAIILCGLSVMAVAFSIGLIQRSDIQLVVSVLRPGRS